MIYEIYCDNCGQVLLIEAKTLKEAEEKSTDINCCKNRYKKTGITKE